MKSLLPETGFKAQETDQITRTTAMPLAMVLVKICRSILGLQKLIPAGGLLRIGIHSVEDYFEILKITFLLAQEPRQQEMGEFDRVLPSIRDDENDINLRKQAAERLHLPELFAVRSGENRYRIRFYRHPEPLPEIIQPLEVFDPAFRDDLMNCGLESFLVFIIPA
ncbi:MAG: hypothetical protein ACYDH0_04600 [Candidatus Aminicenantales bacterium]